MKTDLLIQDFCKSLPPRRKEINYFEIVTRRGKHSGSSFPLRDDCYMMYLQEGKSRVSIDNHPIELSRPALVLASPVLHHTSDLVSNNYGRFVCLFTENFLKVSDPSESGQQPLLSKMGGNQIFFLDDLQWRQIDNLLEKIVAEAETEYVYKNDLIRTYIRLILLEALKIQPKTTFSSQSKASSRITTQFMQLLDAQFPIPSPQHNLQLKTARDYAEQLTVHVNHLNSAVRTITGKTTTTHINERVIQEAKKLLRDTNWNVAEIAYSLGFNYPTYFNNFFKKQTSFNPLFFRP